MISSRRFCVLLPSLACAFLLTACGPKAITLSSYDGSNTATVTVEIADSVKERDKGLMNRAKLEQDKGMLFIFPESGMLKFWMKNTQIPLEVLFFDDAGAFVNAVQMTPCKADPCPQYKAQALSKFALEVTPDFRKTNGIGVGWKLDSEAIAAISSPR